jgi:hypothetical protein
VELVFEMVLELGRSLGRMSRISFNAMDGKNVYSITVCLQIWSRAEMNSRLSLKIFGQTQEPVS